MRTKIKVVELFAGVGGFRLGLEGWDNKSASSSYKKKIDSEYQVIWSNQWEPATKTQHASMVYENRWGSAGHSNENIATVDVSRIPDHDLLVGGFPCQDYSVATTLKNSKGLIGKKGALWWSIHKILSEKSNKPKYLFLENVDRLLKSPVGQRGRDFAIILQSLNELGYAVEWRVINAADYGMPQRRRRIFILGYLKGTEVYRWLKTGASEEWILRNGVFADAFPVSPAKGEYSKRFTLSNDVVKIYNEFNKKEPKKSFENAGVMIDGEVLTIKTEAAWEGSAITLGSILLDDNDVPDSFFIKKEDVEKWKYLKGAKKIERKNADGVSYNYAEGGMQFPDALDKPSRTIITGEGGGSPSRFKHVVETNNGLRRLTPIELERLDMFPDDHTLLDGVSDGKRAFFMGNALVVGVIEKIAQALQRRILYGMKERLPYDPTDKASIIGYARLLVGKTLRESCIPIAEDGKRFSGKGHFGQTLEKYYFGYNPNSDSQPDFPEAGLELKSTPLKQLKNNEFRAKERLVLNIIDYMDITGQDFENSSFWRKNAHLLLVFYLYQKDLNFMDYLVHLVDEWDFPEADKSVIKQDWETIKAKVEAGKAHELSEGDTYYLGACTKGANREEKREQPNSREKAMQRAFSFKASYVNHILASIVGNEAVGYGKAIPSLEIARGQTIEDAIIVKYRKYYGKTVEEIQEALGVNLNVGTKQFFATLSDKIQEYEQVDKAGINVKTVVLSEDSNKPPKENMSFPAFKYEELVTETWEESGFKEMLERKYLFVFFQHEGNNIVLREVRIWNMPYNDIQEAKKVWERTKEIVASGNIVKKVGYTGIRSTNFPGTKFNRIAHVRPHAMTRNNTYPLPVIDKVTGAGEYTKYCFWLNNAYILDIYRRQRRSLDESM